MIDLEMVLDGKMHVLTLEDGEHLVGRGTDCDPQIPAPSVSKNHAVLRVDGERLFVRDLGSTNGTDIEGRAVGSEEVEVPPEATLRLASVAIWRRSTLSGSASNLSNDQDVASSTIYHPTEGYSESARARIVGMLSEIFELIASESSARHVEEAACEFIGRYVDADRVILLEDDGEGTEPTVKTRWLRSGSQATANERLRLSTTIVKKVLSERASVLVANALSDPRFAAQQSIIHLDLKSAMAAPLFDNQRVRGIIYVDCSRPNVKYETEDLQVLTATCNAVAVKLRALTLEKELKTAARIQHAMLPESVEVPAGWELDAHLVMCREVGGDLYHVLQRPNGRTLLVLGDVAGKGIPASLAMAATIVLIRSLNELGVTLEDMAPHLNTQLGLSLAPEQFVTLFVGELDQETGRLRYFNAGHEPPLISRHEAAGEDITSLDSTGRPIGMLPFGDFGVDETVLQPGDLFAVFSDGIPEATSNGEDFFGLEPVCAVMKEKHEAPLPEIRNKILGGIEEMLGKEQASDDVTLMLLRRLG